MKKALALLLVLVLAVGMSSVAFAASEQLEKKVKYSLVEHVSSSGARLDGNGQTAVKFFVQNAALTKKGTQVSPSNPNAATGGATGQKGVEPDTFSRYLGAKIKVSKGGALFDEVVLDKAASTVEIKFKTSIASIKDIDYDYTLYLVVDNSTITSSDNDSSAPPVINGTYRPTEQGDWDDDWFEFTGTNYMKAGSFIRNMEFNFSDDVSVFGRALKGVKYYGFASDDVTSVDEDLMIEHASIYGVWRLSQINVKSVADYVVLNDADASTYVYTVDDGTALGAVSYAAAGDVKLRYLGRGNEKLEFADVYYLSAAEIDLDEEIEPEEEDAEEEEDYDIGDNSGTGGDDLYPENPHDNPGTGK